jgi:hypothetical protein
VPDLAVPLRRVRTQGPSGRSQSGLSRTAISRARSKRRNPDRGGTRGFLETTKQHVRPEHAGLGRPAPYSKLNAPPRSCSGLAFSFKVARLPPWNVSTHLGTNRLPTMITANGCCAAAKRSVAAATTRWGQRTLRKQPQGMPRRASVKTLARTTLRGLQKPKPVLVLGF